MHYSALALTERVRGFRPKPLDSRRFWIEMSELKAHSHPQPQVLRSEAVATDVGRLVRLSRAKRGMTRRQLAHASGASERYLAQIEAGAGNPSVIVLAAVAEALDVPISDLLPRPKERMPAMARILDLVARAPAS